jgi:hypothetical protein
LADVTLDRDWGDAEADVASMLLLITLARHLDRFQAALGGEPMTADRVRALAPDLWRAVDRDAAGLLDTIMGAVHGDGAAINRLVEAVSCQEAHSTIQ